MKHLIIIIMALVFAAAELPALTQPEQSFTDVSLISSRRQNWPDLDSLVALPDPGFPVYGIYSWVGEWNGYHAGITDVNWPNVRIAGAMTDAGMTQLCNDGVSVMQTFSGRLIPGNRNDYSTDDAFLAAYKAAITNYLNKYGPGGSFFSSNPGIPNNPIEYVEIWNEPNFQYMIEDYEPRAACEAERETLYARMLPEAYDHIKANWPTVQVVGFACGGAAGADTRFLQHVLEIDSTVAQKMDIFSTHPYVAPAPPEGMNSKGVKISPNLTTMRGYLAAAGRPDIPVWYTEMGWPLTQAAGGFYPSTSEEMVDDEIWQAAYTVRNYAWAMRIGVERIMNMFVSDTDGYNGGFFNRDHSWRQSATATKVMIEQMPHPKLIGAINDLGSYWCAYSFIADINAAQPETVIMAWDIKKARDFEIELAGASATVTDMLGAVSTVTSAGAVEIGPCPVYIKGAKIVGIRENGKSLPLVYLAGAIQVSPRPFTDAVKLSFNLKKSASVELTVINAAGEIIARPLNGTAAAGEYEIAVHELSDAAPGVYMYVMDIDGYTVSGKFIKQ